MNNKEQKQTDDIYYHFRERKLMVDRLLSDDEFFEETRNHYLKNIENNIEPVPAFHYHCDDGKIVFIDDPSGEFSHDLRQNNYLSELVYKSLKVKT